MTASPATIDAHAAALLAGVADLAALRADPVGQTRQLGYIVTQLDHVDTACQIDATYDPATDEIKVAETIPTRTNFSVLHELGHALAHRDGAVQDWLIEQPAHGVVEEEQIANAFASQVLLPVELVNAHIGDDGPTAHDVATLYTVVAATTSREAVVVRAAQRLRSAGMIVLCRGTDVQFASSRGLGYAIRRGSDQSGSGFFARLVGAQGITRQDDARVVLPGGALSSTAMADSFTMDDGYSFVVLMEANAPWQRLTPPVQDAEWTEVECPDCEGVRYTLLAPCKKCGDPPCPDHGCSCRFTAPKARKCKGCFSDLPLAAPVEQTHCDMCA